MKYPIGTMQAQRIPLSLRERVRRNLFATAGVSDEEAEIKLKQFNEKWDLMLAEILSRK